MSRIDMNIPNTMMRNANSRRGAIRSDGACADSIEDGALAAPAMLPRTTCGSIKVGIAVGVFRALMGVDAGIDRHASAQQVLLCDVARHPHPHRQALHDLGEVSGGVIR